MRYLCPVLALACLGAVADPMEAHPRPDWARDWMSLNGPWRFAFDPEDRGVEEGWFEGHDYVQTIVVPYPWQSPMSGIHAPEYQGVAWYEREIVPPHTVDSPRAFLVFGAVDWHATVWIDGKKVAEHEGGYTPFEVELPRLEEHVPSLRVTVRVEDRTDPETPNGKQTGWYTPTGGIWQTVYLEGRGAAYFRRAHISPDIDAARATFDCVVEAPEAGQYSLDIVARPEDWYSLAHEVSHDISREVDLQAGANEVQVVLPVPEPRLWSPERPHLYFAKLRLRQQSTVVDSVRTYFGMRKVSRGTYNGSAHEYILLNNKPIYLKGALHQSFNPQGVYTHPSDDFLRRDYEKAKEFGLNFIRIHIKVEEPRALYWADKLGVLLMCDMPNYGKKTDRSKRLWEETLRAAVARDFNHPSIFAWCDFNETWGIGDGGYDASTQRWVADMYRLTKELDPTRLVEDNSPCNYDHTETDINSWHFYIDDYEEAKRHIEEVVAKTFPGSEFNFTGEYRQGTQPLINSEYGGVSAGGGDRDVGWCFLYLTNLLRRHDKIGGYVYTELEDIEWEHNGFMNYDRTDKSFPYPAGIRLADLQGDDVPVIDAPPYREVEAGAAVQVPILLSHWSEREGLVLRVSADGQSVDGRPWRQWIAPVERPATGKPFAVTPQEAFTFTAPDAAGLINVVAEVLHEGQRVGATYCVVNVQGMAWTEPRQYAVSFAPGAFAEYTFAGSAAALPEPDGPAKAWGHGAGAIEYRLRMPAGLTAEAVEGCRLLVECGAKADGERVDWPSRRNPQDYPQTDERTFRTDVVVSLNGKPLKSVTIENDFADAAGVLSHAAYFHHGSRGALINAEIEGEALAALKDALAKGEPVRLRFEVPADATHKGGLSIYGRDMGSWPSDPTLIFALAEGAARPQGQAEPVDLLRERFVRLIGRGPDGHAWRYTEEQPGDDWAEEAYDDSGWKEGPGGFGREGTPGARIGTPWLTDGIWLRTAVEVPADFGKKPVWIDLHHDEDAQVYVNGKLLVEKPRYTTGYERIVLSREQAGLFREGRNVVAVHCRHTSGGQFIDLALSTIE